MEKWDLIRIFTGSHDKIRGNEDSVYITPFIYIMDSFNMHMKHFIDNIWALMG